MAHVPGHMLVLDAVGKDMVEAVTQESNLFKGATALGCLRLM